MILSGHRIRCDRGGTVIWWWGEPYISSGKSFPSDWNIREIKNKTSIRFMTSFELVEPFVSCSTNSSIFFRIRFAVRIITPEIVSRKAKRCSSRFCWYCGN